MIETHTRISVEHDPYLWLEEVSSPESMAWVEAHNRETFATLETMPGIAALQTRLLDLFNSPSDLPPITRRGGHFYNVWRGADHPRGLMRRTTLDEYCKPNPEWETVLDIDALASSEEENWVWGGAAWLGGDQNRVLIGLSRGGGDAKVMREFDVGTKQFIADGFVIPEAKTDAAWVDRDTLLLGSDFGPGSLTDSGYARLVKRWRRGTALDEAETIFAAEQTDLGAMAVVDPTPGFERQLILRHRDFFRHDVYMYQYGALTQVDKPEDAKVSFWREWVVLHLMSQWQQGDTLWPSGTALIANAADYMAGKASFSALFQPSPTCSLAAIDFTRSKVVLTLNDNVSNRLEFWRHDGAEWQRLPSVPGAPGTIMAIPLNDPLRDVDPLGEALLEISTSFLTPEAIALNDSDGGLVTRLKSRPEYFDSDGMSVEQRAARSRDGTMIPYFIVWPRNRRVNGPNPTVLHAYGGLNVAHMPSYLAGRGPGWVERGGVFVQAAIRGGGEFGPGWHQAAIRDKRQNAFDDFIAVAEDLIASGITSADTLGIEGGSNGGLLVSAVMAQRPDLFNAVICQVPLTDMRRYHLMLAGASWMAEFGDPDNPADWEFLSRYSPYHNIVAGKSYPPVLFTTSTRDDRVHPAHARKLAALMEAQGHEILYYENMEGGHGGAANNEQRARMLCLEYAFLERQLLKVCSSDNVTPTSETF